METFEGVIKTQFYTHFKLLDNVRGHSKNLSENRGERGFENMT